MSTVSANHIAVTCIKSLLSCFLHQIICQLYEFGLARVCGASIVYDLVLERGDVDGLLPRLPLWEAQCTVRGTVRGAVRSERGEQSERRSAQ